MKRTILKITAFTILAAAIVGTPALSRADDTNATAAAKSDTAGATKFYGTVTAVNTNAMTFTVSDQAYTVTGESQMTKDGKPATLADAVVGEPARGSYTKSSDGKFNVTKVRFGKPAGGKGGAGGAKGGKKKKSADATDSTTTNTPPQN